MSGLGIDGRLSTITLAVCRLVRDANDAAKKGKGGSEFKRPHLNLAAAEDPATKGKPIDAALADAVNCGLISFDPEFGNFRITEAGRDMLDSEQAQAVAAGDEDAAHHEEALANREKDEAAYQAAKKKAAEQERAKDRK